MLSQQNKRIVLCYNMILNLNNYSKENKFLKFFSSFISFTRWLLRQMALMVFFTSIFSKLFITDYRKIINNFDNLYDVETSSKNLLDSICELFETKKIDLNEDILCELNLEKKKNKCLLLIDSFAYDNRIDLDKVSFKLDKRNLSWKKGREQAESLKWTLLLSFRFELQAWNLTILLSPKVCKIWNYLNFHSHAHIIQGMLVLKISLHSSSEYLF